MNINEKIKFWFGVDPPKTKNDADVWTVYRASKSPNKSKQEWAKKATENQRRSK